MKEAVPNYYYKFTCIGDRCKHNCCIGWEIDIDEETMQLYNSLTTDLGERIRKNIEGDVPHFILRADDRCPFLTDKGLCELICECGEEMLCDICALHPRFRNFYSDFIETGLGLCCEEAARIILSETEPFALIVPNSISFSEEEKVFFAKRQAIFSVLQDREKTVGERFASLAEAFGFSFRFSLKKLCTAYLTLERLDERWTTTLHHLQDFSFDGTIFENRDFQILFEQLSVYFIFRHLADALWDEDYGLRVQFALMSCYLIGALFSCYLEKQGDIDFETMVELVRIYSSEVEYSEENMETLLTLDYRTIQ